jgi:hypothetical protein
MAKKGTLNYNPLFKLKASNWRGTNHTNYRPLFTTKQTLISRDTKSRNPRFQLYPYQAEYEKQEFTTCGCDSYISISKTDIRTTVFFAYVNHTAFTLDCVVTAAIYEEIT